MVDPSTSTSEEPSAKRLKKDGKDVRNDMKDATLTAMVHWFIQAANPLSIDDNDVFKQEALISHMFNALKHRRQELNNTGNADKRNDYLAAKLNVGTTRHNAETKKDEYIVFTLSELLGKLDKVCEAYSLPMTKGAPWIGMAAPILATFSLFKARIEELRMGHTKMPRGDSEIEISAVGLNPAHGILLEGIRWSPHLRSACASSCGPLTQIICYRNACRQGSFGGVDYSRKWARVLGESLKHLPTCSDIIRAVPQASDDEFRAFLPVLGNLLLFTSSRQNKKTALPIYAYLLKLKENDITAMKAEKITKCEILTWCQSGRKAVDTYNDMVEIKMPLIKDEYISAQIFFHGVFGSYSDNLEVLRFMVQKNRKWATRSEIGKTFAGLASGTLKVIPVLPIKQYAKPVSSNQSGFYNNVTQQVSTIPTFSGQTKNDCSDLITYLERGGSELMGSAKGLNSIRSILQGHLEKMRESVSKTKIISWGNSEWTTVDKFMQETLTFPKPDVFEMRMFMGNYESEVS